MISGKIIQNTINSIHQVTKAPVALYDKNGNANFSAGDMKDMPSAADIQAFVKGRPSAQDENAPVLSWVGADTEADYIIAVGGQGEKKLILDLAVLQITSLGEAYKEDLDKDNFIKNLLLDNLLPIDVHNRARAFSIAENVRRVVILAECQPEELQYFENVNPETFGCTDRDYITAVDDHFVIIVKQLGEKDGSGEVHETAMKAARAAGRKARAAYGTIVTELKDVSRSYKEAQMAIEIGKIFSPESYVIAYSSLGIGRLIYQLPVPLCRMFIKEIFANHSPEHFDEETITTINKFFENNLNVSETSRQLYIHRNTLVYRLDKIYKMTGLDLRLFEDAITFKIALMVVRYMDYMKANDQ